MDQKPTPPEERQRRGKTPSGRGGATETRHGMNARRLRPQQWLAWFAGAVIVAAIVVAYSNSLRGPLILDDLTTIRDNPTVRTLWPISTPLCPPNNGATTTGRPLLNLTLAVNYAISGLNVWSYHAVNLAIHVLAALLLFGIVRRTLLLPGTGPFFGGKTPPAGKTSPENMDLSPSDLPESGGDRSIFRREESASRQNVGRKHGPVPFGANVATPLALAIALLWAVHPLLTESVTYTVQRAESLVGLFYLLTLYCVIRGTESFRSTAWYVAAALACLAGMASKEVMVSAPLIVLLFDRAFLAGSFREAFRRRYGLYIALAATWILLGWLVYHSGNRGTSAGFGEGVAVDWWTYLCTQFGAIIHYLWLSVWPHPLVFDYGVYTAQGFAQIVPYAIAVVLLGLATLFALWRWPKIGFLGAWFFAILAPTSSFVPVATQTIAEHRMYLPLIAVVVGVVSAAYFTGRRLAARNRLSPRAAGILSVAVTVLLALILATLTVRRNADYASELSIWQDTVQKAPNNARAHTDLGNALVDQKQYADAVAEQRKALEIDPRSVEAHYNLGLALDQMGRVNEAIVCYRTAVEINPSVAKAYNNLGSALIGLGRTAEGIAQYREAIRADAGYVMAHFNLANALASQDKSREAIEHYQTAVQLNPDFVDAYRNLALVLATCSDPSVRNVATALESAQRAVALSKGQDPFALDVLATAYAGTGRFGEAAQAAQQALQLAVEQKNADIINSVRPRIPFYKAGKPFRQP